MSGVSIKKKYFYNTAYQILILLVPLVTTPYLSRILGAAGMGIYSYYLTITSYFTVFIMLGFETYGSREIASHNSNKEELSKTFCSIYLLQLMLGVTVMAIYIGYCFISPNLTFLSLLFALNLVAYCIDVTWFLTGMEAFRSIALRNIVVKALTTAAIFIFVRSVDDLYIYCAIMLTGNVLSAMLIWPVVFKSIKFTKVSFKQAIAHLKPNLFLFLTIITVLLLKTVDKLMLGIMDPTKVECGYYELSERIINIPNLLVVSLGAVMLPRISNMLSKGENGDNYISISIIIAMLIATSMSFGIMGVSKEFVPLFYGSGFDTCIYLYLILLPSSLFMSFANVIRTQFILPRHMDKKFMIIGFIGLVENVVLNAIMIPYWGAKGAAIATTISEMTGCIIYCLFTRKKLQLKSSYKHSLILTLDGAVMFCTLFFIDITPLVGAIWLALLIKIIAGVIIYVALAGLYIFLEYRRKDKDICFIVGSVFHRKAAAAPVGDSAENITENIAESEFDAIEKRHDVDEKSETDAMECNEDTQTSELPQCSENDIRTSKNALEE